MKFTKLIKKSFEAGLSPAVNKEIAPYFWYCVGGFSIALAIFPSLPILPYARAIGGVVFFVIMTSCLLKQAGADWSVPSANFLARRSFNVIVTSLVTTLIILIALLLLIIPGVIASKQLIYSGLIAAIKKVGPIQALKESRKFSIANGYSLLIGTLIVVIPITFLAFPSIFLSTLSFNFGYGWTLVISLIFNLIEAWLSYVVLNHMIIIAFKESEAQKIQ